jgi:hypothetical protein
MINVYTSILQALLVNGRWQLETPVAATIAAAHPRTAAAKPTSSLPFSSPLRLCGSIAFVLHFQHHAPLFPPCNDRNDTAAAITEPVAARRGTSRASRPPFVPVQRQPPLFPPANAAGIVQFVPSLGTRLTLRLPNWRLPFYNPFTGLASSLDGGFEPPSITHPPCASTHTTSSAPPTDSGCLPEVCVEHSAPD